MWCSKAQFDNKIAIAIVILELTCVHIILNMPLCQLATYSVSSMIVKLPSMILLTTSHFFIVEVINFVAKNFKKIVCHNLWFFPPLCLHFLKGVMVLCPFPKFAKICNVALFIIGFSKLLEVSDNERVFNILLEVLGDKRIFNIFLEVLVFGWNYLWYGFLEINFGGQEFHYFFVVSTVLKVL